ncbi:MAG: LL-diaminopimelate aminotransferase [Chloroflexia bacterium]|nr:LL-diaminopimelate aminotransferase [Chloroflexia bacterium]
MQIPLAQKLHNLPPYLQAEANRRIASMRAQGVDVINLGIGNPDMPTPDFVVEALYRAAQNPRYHGYPNYYGIAELRQAFAHYYKRRFDVDVDFEREIIPLIGTKEGLVHLTNVLCNPGDIVLVPDPGYPVYRIAAILAGADVYAVPLLEENGYLPDLDAIPAWVAQRSKLLWINYPNNPTAATADQGFFAQAIEFGLTHNVVIAHDNAYADVTFEGYVPPGFLELEGAKQVGVEFYSLSKTYNMAGWRVGALLGNADVVQAVARVKTNVDSGIFTPVQYAAMAALEGDQSWVAERNRIYQARRDRALDMLQSVGIHVTPPRAGLYIWGSVPPGYSSMEFCLKLLEETGVWLTPGSGFGEQGEGYFRLSLAAPDDRLDAAVQRLASFKA